MEDRIAAETIREIIRDRGRVTFAQYMDLALYHPGCGYYMRDREKIGAGGDFYTSPDVSPLFGKVIGDQAREMWELSGRPEKWAMVEFGAGKGNLARDVLEHTALVHPDYHQSMSYIIVEKSPYMKARQEETLAGINRPPGCGLHWLTGIGELKSPVDGCFFSNELIDAFPVHRLVREGGEYREIYVVSRNGGLEEETGSLSDRKLDWYINRFGVEAEDGREFEINLAVGEWLGEISGALGRGFVLSIDYGDVSRGLYSPARPKGTIRSYRNHRLMDSLYECPGSQDITASVNFSALLDWGVDFGLHPAGLTTQMYFLMNLGIFDYISPRDPAGSFDLSRVKETMAVKKLVMPEGMGEIFKVAAQYKGFDEAPALKGFAGKYRSRL